MDRVEPLVDERRRRWLARAGEGMVWLGGASLLGALSACGGGGSGEESPTGGGGGGSGGGGSGGTAVSPAVRAATLSAARDLLSARVATSLRFDAPALAAQIQALPGIATTGVSALGGNVWARFSDGRYLVVPNGLESAPASGSLPATPLASASRRRALAAEAPARKRPLAAGEFDTPAILTGQQYRQLDMLGQVPLSSSVDAAHFAQDWVDRDTLPRLRRLARGRGFMLPEVQRTEPPDVGIDNGVVGLKSIAGDGVFFITAQGAYVGRDDEPRLVVCIDTVASEANLARFEDDLAADRLVHTVHLRGVDGAWQAVNGFAITSTFVDQYGWRFPTSCIGIFNLVGAPSMSDWIPSLYRAGLEHMLVWRSAVPWTRALAFADDLLQLNLASNAMDGRLLRQPIEPRLRSYGMGETVGYLTSRSAPGGGGAGLDYLQSTQPARFTNTLLPTIDYVTLREERLEIELVGQFGAPVAGADLSGAVSTPATANRLPELITGSDIGARFEEPALARAADPLLQSPRPLQSPNWEGGLLQTVLRHDDLSRGGYVQVVNGGRCSNAVPITHWEIPIRVVTTIDELTLTVDVQVRLRADVHGWRLEPDAFPRAGAPQAALSGSVHSRADFLASGSISHYDSSTRTRTTIDWSGSGGIGNAIGDFAVDLAGVLFWDTRQLESLVLSVAGGRTHAQHTVVEQFDSNGELLRRTESNEDVPVTVVAAGPGAGGTLPRLRFDDRWHLEAGSWEMLPVRSTLLPAPPERQRRTMLTWPAVVPDFPPRDDFGGT